MPILDYLRSALDVVAEKLLTSEPKVSRQSNVMIEYKNGETIVWADDGNYWAIRNTPGVYSVTQHQTRYYVQFDARYDQKLVEKEIKENVEIYTALHK